MKGSKRMTTKRVNMPLIYCKCDLNIRKDISGKRFGRLVAIKPVGRTKHSAIVYNCRCDCGCECLVSYRSLTSGVTKSCGCLQKEMASKANSRHGKSNTKIYDVWQGIKRRCLRERYHGFERYGGRGISICERWMNFESFFKDMGNVPEGLQIDRIDNNKGYSPDNCRWVTPSENCKNTRRNVFLYYKGERLCLADWSRKTGIAARTLSYRVARGCTIEQIFDKTKPPKMKSAYTGVTYSRNSTDKRWMARRTIKGVRKYLGHFRTEEGAYEAYKNAV